MGAVTRLISSHARSSCTKWRAAAYRHNALSGPSASESRTALEVKPTRPKIKNVPSPAADHRREQSMLQKHCRIHADSKYSSILVDTWINHLLSRTRVSTCSLSSFTLKALDHSRPTTFTQITTRGLLNWTYSLLWSRSLSSRAQVYAI